MTPLLWAAQAGHWECIELLCQNYSNLDVLDNNGQTALHMACREGHLNLAQILLEHRCNPNIQDTVLVCAPGSLCPTVWVQRKTPLHLMAGVGNTEMCELLLSSEADVNIVDSEVPVLAHAN